MVFMCIGHKMGFLSGASFLRKPDNPFLQEDDYGSEPMDEGRMLQNSGMHPQGSSAFGLSSNTARTQKVPTVGDPWKSRPTYARCIFIFSAIICITFASLMVTQGLTNLQNSVNTIHDNSVKLNGLADDVRTVIQEGMLDLRDTAGQIRGVLETQLSAENFCPADPNIEDSQFGKELRLQADDVVSLLRELEDFRESELNDLKDAMDTIFDGSEEINNEAGDIDLTDWEALIVLIPYTIFPALMIVAALFAFFDVPMDRYHFFISWFVLPVFILMTLVAIVWAGAMAIAAGVNSDFCLPGGRDDSSPDDNIRAILNIEGYDTDSFSYKVADWYISQCNTEDPLFDTRNYGPELETNRLALNDFIDQLQSSGQIDGLAVYCNRDFYELDVLLGSMKSIVDVLIISLERVLDLAQCGRIIPLYTNVMYDAGCSYSPKAVFWVFWCTLILAFFGMIMITLRSSMKLTVIDAEYVGHFPEGSQSFRHEVEEEEIEELDPNPDHLQAHQEEVILDEPIAGNGFQYPSKNAI